MSAFTAILIILQPMSVLRQADVACRRNQPIPMQYPKRTVRSSPLIGTLDTSIIFHNVTRLAHPASKAGPHFQNVVLKFQR